MRYVEPMQKLEPLLQDYHLCELENGQIPFPLQKSPHRLQTVGAVSELDSKEETREVAVVG